MSKHTPGPWHRNIKPASKYPVIFAGRNTHIACIKDSSGMNDAEVEGNCDLIPAAPDLLTALKIAEKHVASVCDETSKADLPEWFDDLKVIRAAINKAEPA